MASCSTNQLPCACRGLTPKRARWPGRLRLRAASRAPQAVKPLPCCLRHPAHTGWAAVCPPCTRRTCSWRQLQRCSRRMAVRAAGRQLQAELGKCGCGRHVLASRLTCSGVQWWRCSPRSAGSWEGGAGNEAQHLAGSASGERSPRTSGCLPCVTNTEKELAEAAGTGRQSLGLHWRTGTWMGRPCSQAPKIF